MSAPAGPSAKVCGICAADCSRVARVRDTNGRYYCRDCYYKAKERKAAHSARASATVAARPAAAPIEILGSDAPPGGPPSNATEGSSVILDQLGAFESSDAAAASSIFCPDCSSEMAVDAVICTNCGFNRQTGRRLRQVVDAAHTGGKAAEPQKSSLPGPPAFLSAPWMFGVAPMLVLGPLYLIARGNPSMELLFLSAQGFFGFAVFIWTLVVAFHDRIVHGVLSLVTCSLYATIYGVFITKENRLRFATVASFVTSLMATLSFERVGTQMLKNFNSATTPAVAPAPPAPPARPAKKGPPNNNIRAFGTDERTQQEIDEINKTIKDAIGDIGAGS